MTTDPLIERREPTPRTRGWTRVFWDVLFPALRFVGRRARNAYAILGVFLVAGAAIAIAGTWAFASLAGKVRQGATQALDTAALQWIGRHQYPAVQSAMLEVTALGTTSVVAAIVLIAGAFLWLNQHRHSAVLLGAATVGGVLLNNLLKVGFDRPRPTVFTWGTVAGSSSFPSGHAMGATVVYSTVAYLVARLQHRASARMFTAVIATLSVVSICVSRVYLGVHYPSDVLAGVIIGLAWAAFCMALLEATQLYAKRNAPEMLEQEKPK